MRSAPRPSRQPEAPSVGSDGAGNPVLVRLWRGARVESLHRGAWVLADDSGAVLDGAGDFDEPVFARSSVKSLQALPLVESGAAERFELTDEELALALASHDAERVHTDVVLGLLARLGLDASHLRCGPQTPRDEAARAELERRGERPSGLHNNCSGKHAGFLALARHLGQSVASYLDPEGPAQRLVREAVREMAGVDELFLATDGCSAPTFALALRGIATAFARMANPEGLAPTRRDACLRMQRAVAAHPQLIAGRRKRICTALAREGGGRLFPKVGAEAVYGLGLVGSGRGLALKIDDGGSRAMHALLLRLVERYELLDRGALDRLAPYANATISNWAGETVGRTEVLA